MRAGRYAIHCDLQRTVHLLQHRHKRIIGLPDILQLLESILCTQPVTGGSYDVALIPESSHDLMEALFSAGTPAATVNEKQRNVLGYSFRFEYIKSPPLYRGIIQRIGFELKHLNTLLITVVRPEFPDPKQVWTVHIYPEYPWLPGKSHPAFRLPFRFLPKFWACPFCPAMHPAV